MSRPSRGKEVLEIAKDYLGKAKTVEELREAQKVVFPLKFCLTVEHTALAIGKLVRWTSQIRSVFRLHDLARPHSRYFNSN